MNPNELTFSYEQIRVMEKKQQRTVKGEQRYSIDQILEMTKSSKSNWGDAVIEEREESA